MATPKEEITDQQQDHGGPSSHGDVRLPEKIDETKRDLPAQSDVSSGPVIEPSAAPESDRERIKMQ